MPNEISNLSERLRFALKTLEISQTELAKRINVKPQVIQYLCAGMSQSTKFLFDIAEALKVDVSWLATGQGKTPTKNFVKNENGIPLLNFTQIKEWKILNKKIDTSNCIHISIGNDINPDSFAVTLIDQSMSPRFNINTIVIIDPSLEVPLASKYNRFVLVYLAEEDFIVLRYLDINDESKMLVPINSRLYKNINLAEKDIILGSCKEARWSI